MNECIDLETKEKLDESRGRSRKRSPNLQKFTALSLCPDSTPLSPFIPFRFYCKSGSFARIPFQFVNWSSFASRSCSQFSFSSHCSFSLQQIYHSAFSCLLCLVLFQIKFSLPDLRQFPNEWKKHRFPLSFMHMAFHFKRIPIIIFVPWASSHCRFKQIGRMADDPILHYMIYRDGNATNESVIRAILEETKSFVFDKKGITLSATGMRFCVTCQNSNSK